MLFITDLKFIFFNMYTEQIKRRKSNAYFEMATINTPN